MAHGYSRDRAAYPSCMKTDALNRRLRFAKPNPVVARLQLTERDFLLFAAINRHGPLPSHYLFELTRHQARSFKHLQYRLTELYNGDQAGRGLPLISAGLWQCRAATVRRRSIDAQ